MSEHMPHCAGAHTQQRQDEARRGSNFTIPVLVGKCGISE